MTTDGHQQDGQWDDDETIDLSRLSGEPRAGRSLPADETVVGNDDLDAAYAQGADIWSWSLADEACNTASLKRTVPTAVVLPGSGDAPPLRQVAEIDEPIEQADYQLREVIGTGGMGEVFLARQRGLGREVALKRLRHDKDGSAATRISFSVEAVVTGQLDHPNIVGVHELSLDAQGRPFYTMRRVNGQPWSAVYRRRSLQANLDIFLRVCDAVAFAHSRGVLHRDIKPGNVMLGEYGEVLLMDWGLAVAVPGHVDSPAPPLTGLGRQDAVGGTPAYMPPEMARGDAAQIGIHSDVYLLGATLFELLNGEPPHDGRSVRDCLRHAAANQIVPGRRKRGGLVRILARAMASDPGHRFASVWELKTALEDYLDHAESMQLVERASERLEQAVETADYHRFARALYGFEEAMELWPGNQRARQGRDEARWAYAAMALEKHDLDLAQRLIEDDPQGLEDLARQLQEARRERDRKEQAEHHLQRVQAVRRKENTRDWQVLVDEDFADEGFRERWAVHAPGIRWDPGELRVWGGDPSLIIYGGEAAGDVRLSFEIRIEGDRLNDISCFLSASATAEHPSQLRKLGYEFKFGGYDNTRTCLYRAGTLVVDRNEEPLEYGHTYRVVAERIGSHIRMVVDDQVVIDFEDEQVLAGGVHHVVGVIGWLADYCLSQVRIERLGAPLKADLLEVAADHLGRGHINTAVDLYDDVLVAAIDSERRRQAQEGLKRALQLRSLAARMPQHRQRILQAWPQARVQIADDGLRIDIRNLGVADLEPVRGLPIKQLDCRGNRIENLDPLAGMPLVSLHCAGNRIASLEPLRELPLTVLDCADNRIRSLSPIADLPLEELDCGNNRIADLAPVRRLSLIRLDCRGNAITSLAPLVQMPLRQLHCGRNPIVSLTPLARSRLQDLRCPDCRLDSLAGLEGMLLHTLDCADNRIGSLKPLAVQELASCRVDGNPLVDLGALIDHPPPGFSFDCPSLPDPVLIQAMRRWGDAGHQLMADQAQALLALRHDDRRTLHRLARPVGNQRVLLINQRCSWAEAASRCADLDGRLCCPAQADEDHGLIPFMPSGTVAWIGLRGGDEERWLDGRPLEHQRLHRHLSGGDGVVWSAAGWRVISPEEGARYPFIIAWPQE